jgi:hypothetical protein
LKESTASYLKALIEHFCLRDDLSSYDPYDIWKTPLGFRVKDLYNHRPALGLLLAAPFALFDDVVNNRMRLFYSRSESPIVRATAALCLLNAFRTNHDHRFLDCAARHLEWLVDNSCRGYSGCCWGLGFPHAVSRDVVYDSNTPFTTTTPYALEALIAYSSISQETRFHPVIQSILRFFDSDIKIMEEDSETLVTSYGPFRDRRVINAVSYTMYAYAMCLPYAAPDQVKVIETKIRKLYAYIRRQQKPDGSWFYSPDGRSFIDCFHSCIVLKNVIKTAWILELSGSAALVARGYEYLKGSFLNESQSLFKRFAVKNKQGLVRFDLYDNAEALNVALLVGDFPVAQRLLDSVLQHFCRGTDIYSQIDFLGVRRNKNTLRWAVMPFLHAASLLV